MRDGFHMLMNDEAGVHCKIYVSDEFDSVPMGCFKNDFMTEF